MAGARTAARVAAILRQHGEAMTLRRLGTPDVDVAVKAKRYGSVDSIVVNSQTRQRINVKISNAEIAAASWPVPIRPKDALIDAAGKTWIIESVDARSDGGVAQTHFLTATG